MENAVGGQPPRRPPSYGTLLLTQEGPGWQPRGSRPAEGRRWVGRGGRDPCWPARRQNARERLHTSETIGEGSFLLLQIRGSFKGRVFFSGMPPSSHVTCVRCFRPRLDRISCLKLTFCPGEPFSPSKPGTPWVEEKREAVTAQNMQRPMLEGTVTAPAWAE